MWFHTRLEEVEILSENESKVLELLKNMDLNSISPLESLLKLNELKKRQYNEFFTFLS